MYKLGYHMVCVCVYVDHGSCTVIIVLDLFSSKCVVYVRVRVHLPTHAALYLREGGREGILVPKFTLNYVGWAGRLYARPSGDDIIYISLFNLRISKALRSCLVCLRSLRLG